MLLYEDEQLVQQLVNVEKIIRKEIKSGDKLFNKSLDYLFEKNGKMLRPALLLIGSRLGKEYEGNEYKLIQLSAAIETLHTATLLHDDVIDGSSLRRGQESINSKFSNDYSIYMGDYLLSQSFIMLSQIDIPNELSIKIAKAISKICIGEIKQYNIRFNNNISPMEYFRIVSGKTASLFTIALSAGAYISKASDKDLKKLGYIGFEIGIQFQIIDDLLDYIGDEDTVGKELQQDLLRGNLGIPVIYVLNEDSVYSKKIIKLLNKGIDINNVSELIKLVKNSSAIKRTISLAERYNSRAIKLINKLPESQTKEILLDMMPKLLKRIY